MDENIYRMKMARDKSLVSLKSIGCPRKRWSAQPERKPKMVYDERKKNKKKKSIDINLCHSSYAKFNYTARLSN